MFHQAEPMLPDDASVPYHFVRNGVTTTRGLACSSSVISYLLGGQQYHLEHHLFPTVPRSNLAAVRPLVQAFCADNKLSYRTSTLSEAGGIEIVR